jgi:ABC-2 type transport system permease protein
MFFYQLKSELWKLFGKKRTYIGFGMFLLAQLAIILIFRYTNAQRMIVRTIERNGFHAQEYISMLTMASTIIFVLAYTLMPLYVALVGGDLVSKEAEDGTLRMILARPISRVRLISLKWLAGFVFSIVLVLALGLFGLVFCAVWFPVKGGLFAIVPDEGLGIYDLGTGLQHYALVHAVMVAKAATIMSLAFMFSCFNMKPAAATILALSLILIDRILMELPYFRELKPWFLGHYLNVWEILFAEPIAWWRVGQALCIMLGVSLTFFIIGLSVFQTRDIKS